MSLKKLLLISCYAVFLISCANTQNANQDLDEIGKVFKQFMQASADKNSEKVYQLSYIEQDYRQTKLDDAQLKQQLGNFLLTLRDEDAQGMLRSKINRSLLTITRVENSDHYEACAFFKLNDKGGHEEKITFMKLEGQWKVIVTYEDNGRFSVKDDHGYCGEDY